MFKKLVGSLFIIILLQLNAQADHEQLIMGRSTEAFPETMSILQEEIKKAGYTISTVQRVDIGLTGMGYQTDKYRVVFFGKPDEIKLLPKQYPELTTYLPLAIAIFAEEQETVLTAMSPLFIEHYYTHSSEQLKKDPLGNPELSKLFQRWNRDIRAIIQNTCYRD